MVRTLALSAVMLLAAHSYAHGATPVTVYLERGGGTLHAGWDDGDAGTSSLLAGQGIDRLTVPAYRGSDDAWTRTVACVRDRYAAFDVDVVDRRPASGRYVTIMIGGQPSMIGYPRSVSGVAPYNGRVIAGAIAFVFSDLLGNRVTAVCESTAHEMGHVLGLDHTHHCEDLMSYLHGCGEKRFVDESVACGEYGERRCSNGDRAQNSYRRLASLVGLRDEDAPVPAADPPPLPDPPVDEHDDDGDDDDWQPDPDAWDADGWGDPPEDAPPRLSIDRVELESRWSSRRARTVSVAVASTGARVVELAWATPDDLYLFRCDQIPAGMAVTCQSHGNTAVFQLLVGTGERAFAVRITGADGDQEISQPRTLRE